MTTARRNPDATRRNPRTGRPPNQLTLRVLSLHQAGRTTSDIEWMTGATRNQIYGVLSNRGLVSNPPKTNHTQRAIAWRIAKRERETDALCESGEPDRRAWAYRAKSLGGTAAMIAKGLGCELAEAELYVRECPRNWMTSRD